MEVIIQNDFTTQENLKIIKNAMKETKIDLNDIIKILITENSVDFMTK